MFRRPSFLLAGGTLVTPDEVTPGSLRVAGGRIAEIAERISPSASDLVLPLDGAFVYPGLINAHDHLELNLFPNIGQGPYPNSYAWFDDVNAHYRHTPAMTDVLAVPLEDRLRWGGYKNLFSGVTTVAHHNPYHPRLFRNGFPVRVLRRYRWCHSLRLAGTYGGRPEGECRKARPGEPFILHLAEGVDDVAGQELEQLDRLGALTPHTVIVHGVGLTASDHTLLAARGAGLIWCPSSNLFLFGRTPDIAALLGKVPIALGTDSTLSGPPTLFDELRAASRLGYASPAALVSMVTTRPARMLGLEDRAGRLAVSYPADILILRYAGEEAYRNLIAATPGRIYLVMADGIPCLGDEECEPAFRHAGVPYERIRIEGTPKLVARGCRDLIGRLRRMPGISLPIAVTEGTHHSSPITPPS